MAKFVKSEKKARRQELTAFLKDRIIGVRPPGSEVMDRYNRSVNHPLKDAQSVLAVRENDPLDNIVAKGFIASVNFMNFLGRSLEDLHEDMQDGFTEVNDTINTVRDELNTSFMTGIHTLSGEINDRINTARDELDMSFAEGMHTLSEHIDDKIEDLRNEMNEALANTRTEIVDTLRNEMNEGISAVRNEMNEGMHSLGTAMVMGFTEIANRFDRIERNQEQILANQEQDRRERQQILANQEQERRERQQILANQEQERREREQILANQEQERREREQERREREQDRQLMQTLINTLQNASPATRQIAGMQASITQVSNRVGNLEAANRGLARRTNGLQTMSVQTIINLVHEHDSKLQGAEVLANTIANHEREIDDLTTQYTELSEREIYHNDNTGETFDTVTEHDRVTHEFVNLRDLYNMKQAAEALNLRYTDGLLAVAAMKDIAIRVLGVFESGYSAFYSDRNSDYEAHNVIDGGARRAVFVTETGLNKIRNFIADGRINEYKNKSGAYNFGKENHYLALEDASVGETIDGGTVKYA